MPLEDWVLHCDEQTLIRDVVTGREHFCRDCPDFSPHRGLGCLNPTNHQLHQIPPPICFDCQDGEDDAGAQSVTRVGRLVIVDLAGNERLEAWQVKRDTRSRVQMHNQT